MKCCTNALRAGLALLLMPVWGWGCPFCQNAVNAANAALGRAYSLSVLVMLAVPFGVVAMIGWAVFRGTRSDGPESNAQTQ